MTFVCPDCRAALAEWACTSCGRAFPPADGVPVFAGDSEQARWFDDAVDPEWEIERPHGAPRLYRELLDEKFERSIAGVRELLEGADVLTVCGGSGMDAEFLARAGARRVVCSDVSLGAAKRTRERARRHGVDVEPVVADAARLPFADRSFDIAYVHDGLHHIEDPYAGLAEMARVARKAVVLTEPARAGATRLAVRVGLAEDVEDAGNRVERLDGDEVADALRRHGFHVVRCERYAMVYRHEPGRASRVLSAPGLRRLARLAPHALDRVGNKLTVQAVRA